MEFQFIFNQIRQMAIFCGNNPHFRREHSTKKSGWGYQRSCCHCYRTNQFWSRWECTSTLNVKPLPKMRKPHKFTDYIHEATKNLLKPLHFLDCCWDKLSNPKCKQKLRALKSASCVFFLNLCEGCISTKNRIYHIAELFLRCHIDVVTKLKVDNF